MPEPQPGVNQAASPAAFDGRTIEQVMEENKRKAAEIAELRGAVESLKEQAEIRLAELEEKTRLTPAELNEQKTLTQKIEAIKANPEAKPWLGLTEELAMPVAKREAAEAVFSYDFKRSLKLVDQLAGSEGMDSKEFSNEINSILKGGRWQYDAQGNEILPTERVELAYQEWSSGKKIKQELEEAKKGKAPFAEIGSRHGPAVSTAPTTRQEIQEAKEKGSFAGFLAKKAAMQKEIYK